MPLQPELAGRWPFRFPISFANACNGLIERGMCSNSIIFARNLGFGAVDAPRGEPQYAVGEAGRSRQGTHPFQQAPDDG